MSTRRLPHTFAGEANMNGAVTGEVFAVDHESRIIRGRAVPFGVEGKKGGMTFMFGPGAVTWTDPKRVKLYLHHDPTTAVGHMVEIVETPEGVDYAARVARTPEGDRALLLADPDGDAVLDGASIGGDPEGVKYRLADGVHHAVTFPLREISLTPQPVFTDARTTSVSMSHTTQKEGTTMQCNSCGAPAHTGTCDPATLAAFTAASNPNPGSGIDFASGVAALGEALGASVTTAIADGFAGLTFPQREPGNGANGVASFEVTEPSPYRFDGVAGSQSFSEDMRAYASDPDARQRLSVFMEDALGPHSFAVTGANVSGLNPVTNRPDLYVPNLTFTRPLWDLVMNGSIDDKTSFTIPKFASATGLVATHVEGVEPTPGAFTATSQQVNPSAMSGKVEIVREVWDQGGNPQTDAIIWGEMQNGYFEAIEAGIATTLAAVPTAEVNFASAVDSALVNGMTNLVVDLQFARGGNRFTALALDGLLGKALVNAADSTGRKLLPVIGATNAQGEVEPGFDGIKIGNLTGKFAWALGATNASKSYLFVPSSVYAWASAPKKFTFEYRVSAVDIAIWGYRASAVLRDSDVKPLDYTTADA